VARIYIKKVTHKPEGKWKYRRWKVMVGSRVEGYAETKRDAQRLANQERKLRGKRIIKYNRKKRR